MKSWANNVETDYKKKTQARERFYLFALLCFKTDQIVHNFKYL